MNFNILFGKSGDQPRPVGSNGHRYMRELLNMGLLNKGLKPLGGVPDSGNFILPYADIKGVNLANLAGVLEGKNNNLKPVLIGAHYDSVPGSPGADDNLAAICVIFDMIDILKGKNPGGLERPVIISFFDAEEPPFFHSPLMGSINFFEKQLQGAIDCAFILDLVGHDVPIPGFEDLLFITGMESHPKLEGLLIKSGAVNGVRVLPVLNSYVGDMSDHHIFRKNDVPYLFLTCGRNENYHSVRDTSDRLNRAKMQAISFYLANLVESISGTDMSRKPGKHETLATELFFFNRYFGEIAKQFGMNEIRSRRDIDAIVSYLSGRYSI